MSFYKMDIIIVHFQITSLQRSTAIRSSTRCSRRLRLGHPISHAKVWILIQNLQRILQIGIRILIASQTSLVVDRYMKDLLIASSIEFINHPIIKEFFDFQVLRVESPSVGFVTSVRYPSSPCLPRLNKQFATILCNIFPFKQWMFN